MWILRRRGVFVLGCLFLFTVGCRSVVPVTTPSTDGVSSSAPLTQRIFVVVHGDASYLYHDSEGRGHRADVETLQEAFAAARSLPRAEVFIFHQRPHDALLGVLPRPDGTLYHFRHGRLQRQRTYDQNRSNPLAAEAALVRTHRAHVPDTSLFTAALYYGHAVPERSRSGYHRSKADIAFGIDGLAEGLDRLQPMGPLNAVVLSTCNGGTPPSVAAIAPHARTLVAAPGDLHLSFIDADLLPGLSTTNAGEWTRQLAGRAYDRLRARVTTGVTLARYDLQRAAPAARRMATQVSPDTSTTPTGARLVDCRRVKGVSVDTSGVQVWHRPAQFGPTADWDSHSGWGCPGASRPERAAVGPVNGDRGHE